jgi:hypothetical protein
MRGHGVVALGPDICHKHRPTLAAENETQMAGLAAWRFAFERDMLQLIRRTRVSLKVFTLGRTTSRCFAYPDTSRPAGQLACTKLVELGIV